MARDLTRARVVVLVHRILNVLHTSIWCARSDSRTVMAHLLEDDLCEFVFWRKRHILTVEYSKRETATKKRAKLCIVVHEHLMCSTHVPRKLRWFSIHKPQQHSIKDFGLICVCFQ